MRERLLQIHRWLGIGLCLLLLSQAITGIIVTYRVELNRLLHASAFHVTPNGEPRPVAELLASVRAAHPADRVDLISFPAAKDEAIRFRLALADGGTGFVTVDPYSGAITRDGGLAAWPVELAYVIHDHLAISEDAKNILGIEALGLLFIALTGPLVWWRGKRSLGVTLDAGANRWVRDLHRSAGVVLCLFLAATAATGAALAWQPETRQAIAALLPYQPKLKAKVAVRGDTALLPIDLILARAAAIAGHPPRSAAISGMGESLLVQATNPGIAPPDSADALLFDGYSGELLKSLRAADWPAGNRVDGWILPIHKGTALGAPGRVLTLVLGCCLAFFAVSGPWLWWRRRRRAEPALLDLRIVKIDDKVPGIRVIELRSPRGAALPRFTAGAHIPLHLPNGMIRPYSLANCPSERHRYVVAIRRAPQSRGGSAAAHDLRPGDSLRIGPPRNAFPLDRTAPHSLFCAGGIGITPLLAMAHELHRQGRSFELHYGFRQQGLDLFAGAQARRYDSLKGERIDFAALLAAAPAGSHLYLCGPEGFIADGVATAQLLGWDTARIHQERFTAAALPGDRPFTLRLARSGLSVIVPASRTALDILSLQGVAVPSSCGAGICGSCAVGLLDGVADHRDRFLSQDERSRLFTPCCSRAQSDTLVLDL